MNYEAHLNTVFETSELSDVFMREIIKTLNELTFNGARKINGINKYGLVTIKFNEWKGTAFGGQSLPKESYVISIRKAETITLD